MRKRIRQWVEKNEKFIHAHRKKLIALAAIVIILIIFSGTKAFLYVNLMLGNDIIVRLTVEPDTFDLTQGDEMNLSVDARVITNPFCAATCTERFVDLSSMQDISTDRFTLRTGDPFKKTYTVHAPGQGHGMRLYRVEMECRSEPSLLCHTEAENFSRGELITLKYSLSPENALRKAELGPRLEQIDDRIAQMQSMDDRIRPIATEVAMALEDHSEGIEHASDALKDLEALWEQEDYAQLEIQIPAIERDVEEQYGRVGSEEQEILAKVATYNAHAGSINDAIAELSRLPEVFVDESNRNSALARAQEIRAQDPLDDTLSLSAMNISMLADAEAQLRQDRLPLLLASSEAMCDLNTTCLNLSAETDLCIGTDALRNALPLPNASMIPEAIAYIENRTLGNSSVLEGIAALNERCAGQFTPFFQEIDRIDVPDMIGPETTMLEDPSAVCCALGTCKACCEDCKKSVVIFLHGHAFNVGTPADYSLHAFTGMQQRLEQEGIINAQVLSLYTQSVRGRLRQMPFPSSMRATYYLDVFEEPENYVVVQSKSENIDTYALRTRELIDDAMSETGADSVIIVAHSMGGLVARRYIQIFDDNHVDKLIMIGTPNHGIKGSVANYCTILGWELECRDMDEGSLFLNKLNREPSGVPSVVIIGTGCAMDGEQGDGIVLASSVRLDDAKAYTVRGTCDGLQTLHTELLDVEKYPQVYEIVRKEIKSAS